MAHVESSALTAPDTPDTRAARSSGMPYSSDVSSRAGRVRLARASRRAPRLLVALVSPVVVGVVGLLAWQFLAQGGAISTYLLPTPGQVMQAFGSAVQSGLFARYGATTLVESLLGFLVGALVALPLGYAVAMSRTLAAAIEPYLAASQAIPAVALAPLLVLWLPYGTPPVVALCALIVFFPAAVNTTLGFRTLDSEVVDAARLDGAGRWSLLRHIEAPLALPTILAGLRTSLTLSVTGAVVGEFVLGDQGLGGLLTIARGNFDAPLVFATLLALALLAMALYGVARLLEWVLVYLEA